ncbi:MAG: histidine--tRNA ligase [Deferribacteraceae bacterium]|jgi:histidyl-tRNA synthetase|nr:histidine--tRNA ligase [Deferribacteraceae bacterium]
MHFQRVKGFQDIYGEQVAYYRQACAIAKELFTLFHVEELNTPILEKSEIFNRSIGENTDIVEKEMFSFLDRDGSTLCLRPEGTAGALRAYIDNGCPKELERLYYLGAMFRRENPQKGRFRQFTQIGVEFIGSSSPFTDAEVISLFDNFFNKVGLSKIAHLEINSVGCADCRRKYYEKLTAYLTPFREELCGDCTRRLLKNPLRVFDCKNPKCANIINGAPLILDNLCDMCEKQFEEVKKYLEIFKVDYTLNPRMVRGLDYYTRTAFEMTTDRLGAASALGGGGRYDKLISILGGPDISGVGFAIGLDRVIALMMEENFAIEKRVPDIYIITFPDTFEQGAALLAEVRKAGFYAIMEYEISGVKAQMKRANRSKARYAAILGEDELKENKISLKDMQTSTQQIINLTQLFNFLRSN